MPEATPVAGFDGAQAGFDASELRVRVTAAVGDAYEIGEEVGRGGMAVVYAARERRLRREVALKVLPPDLAFRPDVRARFLREAETAARLNHPNIVPIYAVDERDGLAYIVMTLVHGESVGARLVRERRLSPEFVARVLAQVADALAYAHACGVVHRDVKPDNILLDRESGRAVVTDFGIARAAEVSGGRLTQTGIAVGTPAFMSPEQATGEREIDGRSDLYSLGVVGFLLLTGTLPFEASSTPAMLLAHVSTPAPRLVERRLGLPPALAAVVQRCLAKRPDDRWESASALRDALREAMDRPDQVPAAARTADAGARGSAPASGTGDWAGRRAEDWSPRRPPQPVGPPPSAPAPLPIPGQARGVPMPAGSPTGPPSSPSDGSGSAPQDGVPLEVRINRFRVKVVSNLVLIAFLATLNALTSDFPWAIFPAFGITMGLVGRFMRLQERGARWRDVFPGGTRRGASTRAGAGSAPPLPRPEDDLHRIGGDRLASPAMVAAVRAAVDDRRAIREASAGLSDADRSLVPDVEPTADALLERIGHVASALDRLERDLPGDPLADIDQRVARVEAEPADTPDRERRLVLLTRQRDSLRELADRRITLHRQLESAALALQSLRLDMMKLRSLGVGAAIGDVTSATQEARALSRDIGRAIEVADELRGLDGSTGRR